MDSMDSHLLDICPEKDHFVFPADDKSLVTIGYQPKAKLAVAGSGGSELKEESKGNQLDLATCIYLSTHPP